MFHTTALDAQLHAVGVPIHGCNSNGVVWFKDDATVEHRRTAARVLAAHDYAACVAAEKDAKEREAKIEAEMRRQAEATLVDRGEISR